VLGTFQLAISNAQTWRSVNIDLTTYRGQTVILRFTVLNKSSPGITAAWFDDISLAACGP
jgi:hypothetical protein